MVLEFIFVGLGGFLGSIGRFTLTKITVHFGILFPLGTLLSNAIAGILVGLIFALEKELPLSQGQILFLRTGFLGGLSTFSAFSLETVRFYQSGALGLALLNMVLNLVLSLAGVFLGQALAAHLRS
ncbi:MAG: CrcB family protein [Deltaproteobacteria bacterium]|nr:CrcB family protein [Deltaproteobacteria bacterium]